MASMTAQEAPCFWGEDTSLGVGISISSCEASEKLLEEEQDWGVVTGMQGVVGGCSAESAGGAMLACSRCLVPDMGVSEAALPGEGDPIADRPTPMRLDLELPLLDALLLRSMACRNIA